MTIDPNQQHILAAASRSSIQDSITRLTTSWANQNWLPAQNRYREEAASKVRDDAKNRDNFQHSDLIDYIAASVLGHCYDGWSYLARALEAEMSGDPDAARHLGYYAELRAAMSLLASEGIGVFNRHHAIVHSNGRCQSYSGRTTHQFTWDALEYWATLPKSADAIFEAIKPAGIPLGDWLSAFGGSAGFVADSWLRQWGLDLARLREDGDARNLASYRPTSLTSPGPQSVHDTAVAVTHLWSLCGPGSRGEFSTMDRHLLRLALGLLFQNKTGRSPKRAIRIYESQVSSMLDAQMLAEGEQARLRDLLLYKVETDVPELFVAAARADRPTHIDHSRQVLARATLLLRVATGSLANILDQSNTIFRTNLMFWWTKPAVRRRIWASNGEPDTFGDLWDDVKDALDSVIEWPQGAADAGCGKTFWTSHSSDVAILTTPERIFLWGISQ